MSRKYLDVLGEIKNAFEEGNIPDADVDALLMLEAVSGIKKSRLLLEPELEIADDVARKLAPMVERRLKREPLQQILGEQDFMGLTFYVNQDVLCPRYDTEILVEEVMRYLHDGMSILDVCTGSGCILLSLLHYSNNCSGIGVDLSKEALFVAQKNAETLGLNATFIQSDLFEKVEGKFDIIVSNPPYIRSDVIETLMPEVRDYEPRMALDGMEDGLHFYRRIIDASREHMGTGSMLFFEIGYDQGEDVSEMMREAGFIEVSVVKDYAGLDRVVIGTYSDK